MSIAGISRRQALAPLAIAVVTFLLVLLLWMLTHSNGGVAAALAHGKTPVAPSFSIPSLRGSGSIKLESFGGRGDRRQLLGIVVWAMPGRDSGARAGLAALEVTPSHVHRR